MVRKPGWALVLAGFALMWSTTIAYGSVSSQLPPRQEQKDVVPVGLFIGKIEEGARIFTPVRLLPFEHPDSESHEFPNALQLHQSEYEALVWLGELIGLKLAATLLRYPRPPVEKWWYEEFEEVPVGAIKRAKVRTMKKTASPIPGLKAIVFYKNAPICFIVDTRDLTLQERGMTRPTTMGLDMTRAQFLTGLQKVAALIAENNAIVIFEH